MATSLSVRIGLRLANQHTCAGARPFSTSIPKCSTASRAAAASDSKPHSSSASHFRPRQPSPNSSRSTIASQSRRASTTANPLAGNPEAAPTTSPTLDWNTFFRLRTTRRYYSLSSSLIGLVASTGGTFYFLTSFPEQADSVVKLIPMDPIISMGIAMTAAMATGWLVGPIFGNAIWRLLYRKRLPEFTVKERAFFERVKKHRVNPAGASTNNPVPDFYGEKIGSVQGYRRWLKDQRAFNRKRGGDFVKV